MCRPACAIGASSPAVLSATVLPPVLGPAMTRTRAGGSAAGCRPGPPSPRPLQHQQSGCRAPRSSNAPSGAEVGLDALQVICENRARRLHHVELGGHVDRALEVSGRTRKASVSASRMRRTSSASSSSRPTMSLLISTVPSGSRNRLAPLADAPCTMPGMAPRCSARTIST